MKFFILFIPDRCEGSVEDLIILEQNYLKLASFKEYRWETAKRIPVLPREHINCRRERHGC